MDPNNPNPTDTTAPAVPVTTDQPATPPAGTAPAAPAVPNGYLSQEEVNRVVQKRLEEDRARRSKEPASKLEPTKPEPTTANGAVPDDKVQQMIEREGDFRAEMASAGLDAGQVGIMRALFRSANPSDVQGWCKETLATMKLGKQNTPPAPAAPAAPTATPEQPATPPATAPNAPAKVETIAGNGLTDIWNLTLDQVNQLGPQGLRTEYEKIIKVGQAKNGAPPRPKVPQRT